MASGPIISLQREGERGFPMAQLVNNLPATWETWVQSLGWEDPLEREGLPTPVLWPGEFHGLYVVHGSQRAGHDQATFIFTFKGGKGGSSDRFPLLGL